MSVGELLDAAFSLYRRNFLLIAAISALVQVPYAAIQLLVYQISGYADAQQAINNLSNNGQPITLDQLRALEGQFARIFIAGSILALLAIFVVQPLAVAATTRAVSDRYLDRESSVGSSYKAAFRRLASLVVQSLILLGGFMLFLAVATALILLLGFVAGGAGVVLGGIVDVGLFVYAIMVYVRTSLAAPAIVLEGLSGWKGLVRSWSLVRGLSWRIFGIRLLVGLITGIISGILTALLGIAGSGLDVNGRSLVLQVIGAFVAVFINPITYITVTLLYYDTRIRKEGFDIEMLAQSL